MKYSILLSLLMLGGVAHAGLEPMTSDDMQAAEGQGGADISLIVSWNHGIDANGDSTNQLSSDCTTNYQLCRLGVAFNNRNDATGNKIWLVFKGIQGTINIQKVTLDAADLAGYDTTDLTKVKAVIKLGFSDTTPILFRNVGFQSLSIETDTVANEGASNIPGYLNIGNGGAGVTAFAAGKYTAGAFDTGRQTGFTGLNMHGNLALAGSLKIFSYTGCRPLCP